MDRSMPWRRVGSLTALSLLVVAAGCEAGTDPVDSEPVTERLAQGGPPGSCDDGSSGVAGHWTVKGVGDREFTIAPFASGGPVADFYSFGSPDAFSANTGLEVSNRSTILFHEAPGGELSLVLIHDRANDRSGGRVEMKIRGVQGSTLAVEDDPENGTRWDRYFFGPQNRDFRWEWGPCCTDGLALTLPEELEDPVGGQGRECIQFVTTKLEGISGVDLLQADGTRYPVAHGKQTFRVCRSVCCPSPETCNGFDDDCDGVVDEGLGETPTTCSVGACSAEGVRYCDEGGMWVDTCEVPEPAEDDATCDGVDDDCDGETDEDYEPTPTTCGTESCSQAGELRCVGGETEDTCGGSAGSGGSLEVCDGIDNDCDGEIDEAGPSLCADVPECAFGSCYCTKNTYGEPTCILE